MKGFTKIMLGVIFASLIACSVQFATADDSQEQKSYEEFQTKRMKLPEADGYKVHLQVMIRDSHGQLVNVVETTHAWKLSVWLPDGKRVPWLTDAIFDYVLGEKEIITIDNIKYEKGQYVDTPNLSDSAFDKNTTFHILNFCGIFEGYGNLCLPAFEALTPQTNIVDGDIIKNQWTILRAMD